MNIPNLLNNGLNYFNNASQTTNINLINYSVSGVSNASGLYDDQISSMEVITGSKIISGTVFPMHNKFGSTEAMLLQQGKLLTTDKVLYMGSVSLNSSGLLIIIAGGSYSIIPDGIMTYSVNGSFIYNKIFIRQILGGSLF